MLQIGDEVLIVDEGGQYCFVTHNDEWLRELPNYNQGNSKSFVGETAIITILFSHGDSEDGWVYGITLPSGEQLIYEEFEDDGTIYLKKVLNSA